MHIPTSGLQPTNDQHPSILSIRLLGGFHLSYQGEAVNTVNTTRLQSLLTYLVLHKEAPIPRQQVAFLFWPDSSEAQARTNLRNLLHGLRAALPHSDHYLFADKHSLHWRPSKAFSLDVDNFSSLASDTASLQDLKVAVTTYTGDLLPDCYDDWIQPVRERLQQSYLTALEKLLVSLADGGQPREALEYAQVLLRYDPIREETYRHLMRLHAQLGDRASVVRTYKTCVLVLKQELDVKPSSATVETYQKWVTHHTDWSSYQETKGPSPQEFLAVNNLPTSLTSLIGRKQELKQLSALLSNHRLVTLSGIGGVGKTRLALATATEMPARYRDGLFLVDLAQVSDPEKIVPAITGVLYAGDDVRVSGLGGLANFLSDQNMLLILDNCEHLTQEVGRITATLLRACPELTILATSRVALKVEMETVWQVPPLLIPGEIEVVETEDMAAQVQSLRFNESVELFVERATSNLPTFTPTAEVLLSIGEICRRLEGIPLAIEMAAARVKMVTVKQIVQRLDDAIGLLQHPATDISSRHQTMQAIMDWSFAMLTPVEGKLFARLSVFAGDFSLQAVEMVCQGQGIQEEEILDLLAGLVDQSLVQPRQSYPEIRFRLHELTRQYAYQKLQTQDNPTYWQDRHLDYFVDLAEEAEIELRRRSQIEWFNRLDLERENIRVALRWALDEDKHSERKYIQAAVQLVKTLWGYWFTRGWFSEGRYFAEQTLDSLNRTRQMGLGLGSILYIAASLSLFQGDLPQAAEYSYKSLAVCEVNSDIFGQVMSHVHLGSITMYQRDIAQADNHFRKGFELATAFGDPWLEALVALFSGDFSATNGDTQSAQKQYQHGLDIARRAGVTFHIVYLLAGLAKVALKQGNTQQAAMFIEEGLHLSELIGEKRVISRNLNIRGRIAMQEEHYELAHEIFGRGLRILWATRDRLSIVGYLINIADNAIRQGKLEFAARLLAACERVQTDPRGQFQLPNQVTFERLVEDTRMRLDEGVFTAAWTLGGLMSLGQAVAFALADQGK